MKASNILWDIDFDEAYERLDEMTSEEAAKALECPKDLYANMTTEERHDYAYSLWHHCPAALEEFMGLPDEVEVPDSLTDDEDISDWLSDEYGFCHRGFRLSTDDQDDNAQSGRTDREKLLSLIAYVGDTEEEISWMQEEFGITDQDLRDAGIDIESSGIDGEDEEGGAV